MVECCLGDEEIDQSEGKPNTHIQYNVTTQIKNNITGMHNQSFFSIKVIKYNVITIQTQ